MAECSSFAVIRYYNRFHWKDNTNPENFNAKTNLILKKIRKMRSKVSSLMWNSILFSAKLKHRYSAKFPVEYYGLFRLNSRLMGESWMNNIIGQWNEYSICRDNCQNGYGINHLMNSGSILTGEKSAWNI